MCKHCAFLFKLSTEPRSCITVHFIISLSELPVQSRVRKLSRNKFCFRWAWLKILIEFSQCLNIVSILALGCLFMLKRSSIVDRFHWWCGAILYFHTLVIFKMKISHFISWLTCFYSLHELISEWSIQQNQFYRFVHSIHTKLF